MPARLVARPILFGKQFTAIGKIELLDHGTACPLGDTMLPREAAAVRSVSLLTRNRYVFIVQSTFWLWLLNYWLPKV